MRKHITYFICLLAALTLVACGNSVGERWQEQYDLGQKYLQELDYEQALVAFTNAIEIAPNKAEAYLGRAKVYVGQGDYESALADLDTLLSIDLSFNDEAKMLIESMGDENQSGDSDLEETRDEENHNVEIVASDIINFEDVLLFGTRPIDIDIQELQSLLIQNGYHEWGGMGAPKIKSDVNDDESRFYSMFAIVEPSGYRVYASQYENENSIAMYSISYDEYSEGTIPIGFRDISMGDSLNAILEKIGVENASEILNADDLTAIEYYADNTSIRFKKNESGNDIICEIHLNQNDDVSYSLEFDFGQEGSFGPERSVDDGLWNYNLFVIYH